MLFRITIHTNTIFVVGHVAIVSIILNRKLLEHLVYTLVTKANILRKLFRYLKLILYNVMSLNIKKLKTF